MTTTSNTIDETYPRGMDNVVFARDVICDGAKPIQLYIVVYNNPCHMVPLQDECTRLCLDETGRKMLVRRICENMLLHWTSLDVRQLFYATHWSSALLACRTYLEPHGEDDKVLYQKLLLATVVLGGYEHSMEGFIRSILPDNGKMSLQEVVDHLMTSGCSEEDIRRAWSEMLKLRAKNRYLTRCIIPFWEGITLNGEGFLKEAEPVARDRLLDELYDILVRGTHDRCPQGLDLADRMEDVQRDYSAIRSCLKACDHDLHLQIEDLLVQAFACGWVTTASQVLLHFGRNFRLWSEKDDDSHDAALKRLMCRAMSKAEEEGVYGIASALAERLDDTNAADRNRERARSLK